MQPEIRHNRTASRFEAVVDGAAAFAEYVDRGGTLVLTHTHVPAVLRGRGLAGALVRTSLEFARQEGKAVDAKCSFAAAFIDQHPEFADLRRA